MATNAQRIAAATLAAAFTTGSLSGCASLNAQNLPSEPCGRAGFVPVRINSGAHHVAQVIRDKADRAYMLIPAHEAAQIARQQGAATGAAAGLALTVLGGSSLGGKVLATIAGGMIGGSLAQGEGSASFTGNLSACFMAINRGNYADMTVSMDVKPGGGSAPIGQTQYGPGVVQQHPGRPEHCTPFSVFLGVCSPNTLNMPR